MSTTSPNEFDFSKLTDEELSEALEAAKDAEFCLSMSDNFCYTNGRIYPLQRKVKALELEKENRK